MKAILIMFHCEMNAGYAIDSLLDVFLKMAMELITDKRKIHISFIKTDHKHNRINIDSDINVLQYDPANIDTKNNNFIENYIRKNDIDVIFGFDQPVSRPSYKYLRRGGIKFFISYCGAPSSGINSGLKLMLKKLEVFFTPYSPDHYIYESKAMAMTAYNGRGISKKNVSIVHLGVDTNKYQPSKDKNYYAHKEFDIPLERKIIYYSGHMEERKGVAVLIDAAKHLAEIAARTDFHFLILGNRPGEEKRFIDMLGKSRAKHHVTFAGYRNDIEYILPSCYLGAIASTGWDSFTMSSLEIAACGIPLLVSNLQGLAETVENGHTGLMFEKGDHIELAYHIQQLCDDEDKRNRMGRNARKRIESSFSKEVQTMNLVKLMRALTS